MYGIIVFCLFFKSVAFGSNDTTTNSNFGPSGERYAKDGAYLGCYALRCLELEFHPFSSNTSNLPTPDSCTASCKETGIHIAALYNRTECDCSCEIRCFTKPLEDTNCGLPCRGDLARFCGGFEAASLFAVSFDDKSKTKCMVTGHGYVTDRTSVSRGDNPKLAIPVSIPTIICTVIFISIIVFVCRRRLRLRSEAIPQPASLQRKDPKETSNKHYEGLHKPPTGLPAPLDAYVPHPMPQNTSEKHLYHLYAEADQQGSSTPHPSHGHIPSSGSSATVTSPYTQSTPNIGKTRSDSDEYHEYTYADQIKPKPNICDRAGANDEEGYIILDGPSPCSPSPSSQVVYYSSTIPKPNISNNMNKAGENDEEGYVIPDGPSASSRPQEVYYSSKIPRGPAKDKVPSPQRPSPVVYYSSRFHKPEEK